MCQAAIEDISLLATTGNVHLGFVAELARMRRSFCEADHDLVGESICIAARKGLPVFEKVPS